MKGEIVMDEKIEALRSKASKMAEDSMRDERERSDAWENGYNDALDDVESILKKEQSEILELFAKFDLKHDVMEHKELNESQPVIPKPCIKGIDMRTMKALILKLHEELTEFEQELFRHGELDDEPEDVKNILDQYGEKTRSRIAEEGADVATMIATICNAIGIDEKMRFDAQAYVNQHNHERGRL